MGNRKSRSLRFLVTSALLVGPAMGCGGDESEHTMNEMAPVEETGNEEPEPSSNEVEPEVEPVVEPVDQPREPRVYTNERPEDGRD